MKKISLIDVLQIIFFVFILYFFIRGVVDFYQDKITCDFTTVYRFIDYNYSNRLNMNQIKSFVNTTGLFDNGYLLNERQSINNCTFKW